ncbi:MAG: ADP-ribosylglycohydrolase family protein [Planctomycetota bacterium]
MIGAIAGDIIGSRFEQHPIKTTEFRLFSSASRFTDDTVLTCAVASARMTGRDYAGALRSFAKRYPDAGYGMKFRIWAMFGQPQRFSWGNGAAMRVSPIGWAAGDIDEAVGEAELSAVPSHTHPEAVSGAQAVAAAVYLARTGSPKDDIRRYIEGRFQYDLSTPLEAIRPTYRFNARSQASVPQAIRAFLEADDYESAVRLAVSLGGDSDTQACIAGAIAEAAYGVPADIRKRALARLDDHLRSIVEHFEQEYGGRR